MTAVAGDQTGQKLTRHQQRRDRIARQADDRLVFADGENGRLARFGGQAMLQDARLPQPGDDIAGVVARRDRAAGAEQQDVASLKSVTRASLIIGEVVGGDAQAQGLRAQLLRQRAQRIGVDIAHFPGRR